MNKHCDRRISDAFSAWLKQHTLIASFIVISCSLGVRLAITLTSDQSYLIKANADAATYLVPAENLLGHGSFFNLFNQPEITRTPGYPIFLAAVMSLVGQNWRTILITQTIIVSFTVLISYWTALSIFRPLTAFIGALFAGFSPWGAVRAGLPLTEGVYLLVLSMLILNMIWIERAKGKLQYILGAAVLGILTAAAILIRPVWPLVIIVAAALVLVPQTRNKRIWVIVGTMFVFSVVPLLLWTARNQQIAHFNGFTDVSGKTAWYYLAARVKAYAANEDPWSKKDEAVTQDYNSGLSGDEADRWRWQQINSVFREHPLLLIYILTLNAGEHLLHPSPDILWAAGLNFKGDFWLFAVLWGLFLIGACLGVRSSFRPNNSPEKKRWIGAISGVCLALTLAGGVSFGQGSRLRAPLELIVPFMAAEGFLALILPVGRRS